MKILITGSNGFLGSHLCRASVISGHETVALIRSGADISRIPEHKKLSVETINYASQKHIDNSFDALKKKYGQFDAVIHNAGLTVSADRNAYFKINSQLTAELLAGCVARDLLEKTGTWTQISSYAAHGPEKAKTPVSAYGESKLLAEEHVKNSGLNYQIFRPTGIYGSGDLAFLPLFRMAKFGFYPMLAPTNQKLTMIHGADVATAVLQKTGLSKTNETYHLSDGNIYTHQDFKQALEKSAQKKLRMIKIPLSLVKGWLKLSDFISKTANMQPGMTSEKYLEITGDWDLSSDRTLHHPQLDLRYNLEDGFSESYKYYKSVNLL